ncbi:MAG: MraY family glycosyltransferase [Candidatus Moraniibacteriota bacterium]
MLKYLIPFLIAFLLTSFFIFIINLVARKISWAERISERHIHRKNIYRVGGVAMVVAFNISILFNYDLVLTPELVGFMVASMILMVVGVWDDFRELFWKTQLFFQMAIAVFIFIVGVRIYYITNPITGGVINLDLGGTVLIALGLVIFWVVLVMNAINWLDGVDGLSGGITLISLITIFFLSFRPEVNQPPVAIIAAALIGTSLGFLIFNFNPAKVLAGTSGSFFMGLSLSVLAIFSGTKIATAVLVLAIPILDFIWVIGERIKNKKSIFKADKNHLHHKLLEIGWSQKKIATTYYFITLVIAFVALNTRAIGKSVTLIIFGLIMVVVSWEINRRIKKLHS